MYARNSDSVITPSLFVSVWGGGGEGRGGEGRGGEGRGGEGRGGEGGGEGRGGEVKEEPSTVHWQRTSSITIAIYM